MNVLFYIGIVFGLGLILHCILMLIIHIRPIVTSFSNIKNASKLINQFQDERFD